jgi:hypothetical protein
MSIEKEPLLLNGRAAFSPQETGEMIGRCRAWVLDRIAAGEIRAIKLGRRYVVSAATIRAIIEGNAVSTD